MVASNKRTAVRIPDPSVGDRTVRPVSGVLVAVVAVLCLLMGIWAVAVVARDKRIGRPHLVGLAIVELAVLALVVDGFVELASGTRPVEFATSGLMMNCNAPALARVK